MKARWMKPIALLAPALLMGCGNGTTGPVGGGVQIADVARIYEVCTLAFVPDGAQPVVDLRTSAFETQNPDVARPQLRIDASGELQLAFTPREQFVQQDIRGNARMNNGRVLLDFDQRGTRDATALLLPDPLLLNYSPSPVMLSVESSPSYNVARATYAQLAGVSQSGLAEQIPGRLTATFSGSACP